MTRKILLSILLAAFDDRIINSKMIDPRPTGSSALLIFIFDLVIIGKILIFTNFQN